MAPEHAAAEADATGVRDEFGSRLGLTVPHEWWPSAHLLKSFEAAGFAYVQVDAPPAGVLAVPRLARQHALALLDALGTTALDPILHAPSDLRLGEPGSGRAIDGLLGYAAEVGAGRVVYHALAFADSQTSRGARDAEARELTRAARRAAELNLTIAIENICPVYPSAEVISADPMSLRSLVKSIGSEGLGLCLDVGHAHVSAELRRTSIESLAERALDCVSLFHVHDNFGARRDPGPPARGVDPLRLDLHLPPGRGTVPWHAIAPLLAAQEAPVVCEVHPPFRPRAAEIHEDAALLLATG